MKLMASFKPLLYVYLVTGQLFLSRKRGPGMSARTLVYVFKSLTGQNCEEFKAERMNLFGGLWQCLYE